MASSQHPRPTHPSDFFDAPENERLSAMDKKPPTKSHTDIYEARNEKQHLNFTHACYFDGSQNNNHRALILTNILSRHVFLMFCVWLRLYAVNLKALDRDFNGHC